MEKQCGDCNVVKSTFEFYKRGVSNDGLQCRCKSCDYKRHKNWRLNNEFNLTKMNEYMKKNE